MQAENLLYLYCIASKPFRGGVECSNVRIHTVHSQGMHAIVSEVSPAEFSEANLKRNLTDMEWVEKRIRRHEEIIEGIMKDATVLPFKFGTVFKSFANVEKLLKEHGSEFEQTMKNLDGREEWGLKIYCNLDEFKEVLIKADESTQALDEQISSAGRGKAYLLRKKKESLIDEAVNREISEYTQDSFVMLKKVCSEARINRTLPKEVTERGDEMVFNAAFLIKKDRINDFKDAVSCLKDKYSGKGLAFDCTGPWPAYNFSQMRGVDNE